jgi:ADP-ribose pyrophosphatase YjhB (NUDIX family)
LNTETVETQAMRKSPSIRYQAAIFRDDEILLIKCREQTSGRVYWLLPGGGRETGETEIECVQREV